MEEDDSISAESLSLDTLASIRSLIINADTSDSVISSVFDFLTGLLSRGDSEILHHVLKLLSDLAFQRKELAPRIFDSVLSSLLRPQNNAAADASHGRVAVESLAVLASLSETNPSIATALSKIDGEVFASICLGAPLSSRLWLLRNAERFYVPSSVLFTLCLGFSKDPYPYIRKVALDGLISICKVGDFDHAHAVQGCYSRAVELLSDAEDSVRSSAVRAVSMWGKVMIASKEEETKRRECSDAVFLQLCSIVRDMSIDVRIEVFKAFGVIGTASESVILQTLSKKVLGAGKGKKPQNHLSNVSAAAGVFIHGFEDEFYEVREAAVDSFHSLSVNSIKFPDEAVYLLMDMLYDDYMVVRLKALEALRHIADLGNLKLQETYMPAFLDAIVDTSENIRIEARNILKLAKLPDLKLVNRCVDGVLKSLEMYPQDEPDILSALFYFGQNHANFSVSMVKRFSEKLGTASGNKSEFNSRQLSASLMLIISAPLLNKQSITSIPPLAFSCSIAMLGKFSCGLHDMMDQDMLLAYLTHCAMLSASSGTEFNKGDMFFHAYRHSNGDLAGNPVLLPSKDIPVESKYMASEAELETRNQAHKFVNHILLKIKAAWLLSQSGCWKEALQALRACKQELATLTADSSISIGALEFMCQYVQVIELLAQVWPHFEYSRHISTCRSVELELLMEEVETKLMEMRCRFTGLSTEESLVMELVIFGCLVRLYKFEICCRLSCMEKLSSTISQLEFHHEQQGTKPSDFLTETKKSLQKTGSSADINFCRLLDLIKIFNCFSPEQFTFSGNLQCVSAELEVPGNGPYSPISFVPGLPVAIPCEIKLLNVPRDTCLWLRISRSDETCQYVYLDPNLYNGDGREKRFMFNAVTYMTPRAVVLTLRVSIGIECLFEDTCYRKRRHGPKHPVAYMCKERKVHLCLVSRT
ncbi:Protein SIEL [Cardamine amara subsp. amara]|uniref:Protein SIEL n=1 Tax=Cardamine amara subsp. amara TaxID=228776 RepID=A0ABD0ZGK4_CARAN